MASVAINRHRVKLYELTSDFQWNDNGCGHLEIARLDDHSPRIKVVVVSETNADETLLEDEVLSSTAYKRQQDTLILWTDESGKDLALSFQEKASCVEIWARLRLYQNKPLEESDSASEGAESEPSSPITDTLKEEGFEPLPECGVHNLRRMAEVLAAATPAAKDHLATQILHQDYVGQLCALLEACEALDAQVDLNYLCLVFRGLLNLNDNCVCDELFKTENIIHVIGALEYDPDLPERVRHREILEQERASHPAVPITDQEVADKIITTHRLVYLRDSVLSRTLDDATAQIINTFIFFNHTAILRYIATDEVFLPQLLTKAHESEDGTGPESDLLDVLRLVRECVGMKNVQLSARALCYQALIDQGVLTLLPRAFLHTDPAFANLATEVLSQMVSFDAKSVRTHMLQEWKLVKQATDTTRREEMTRNMLMNVMTRCVVSDAGAGLKSEVAENLAILLDTDAMDTTPVAEKNDFLRLFYDHCFDTLIEPIVALHKGDAGQDKAIRERRNVLYNVIDLLSSLVRKHTLRARGRLIKDGVIGKVAMVIAAPYTYLALAATRFIKTVVQLKDEFYNRNIVAEGALEPALLVLHRNKCRQNMLNSALLELFNSIAQDPGSTLERHLAEAHQSHVAALADLPPFRILMARGQANAETNDIPQPHTSPANEDEAASIVDAFMNLPDGPEAMDTAVSTAMDESKASSGMDTGVTSLFSGTEIDTAVTTAVDDSKASSGMDTCVTSSLRESEIDTTIRNTFSEEVLGGGVEEIHKRPRIA